MFLIEPKFLIILKEDIGTNLSLNSVTATTEKALWIKRCQGLNSVSLTCMNPSRCPILTLPNIGLIQGHCLFTHYSETQTPLLFFSHLAAKPGLT